MHETGLFYKTRTTNGAGRESSVLWRSYRDVNNTAHNEHFKIDNFSLQGRVFHVYCWVEPTL